MHKYDYGKISSNLPSDILRLIGFIREAKTKDLYRKSQYMREYEDILSIAKVASVKFSNAIENIVSTDERIRELVVRGGRPLNHSEEEIAELSEWVAGLDPEIPLHVTRFFPCFHMTDRGPTEVDSVIRLAEAARRNLKYVYTGNI